MMKKKLIAIVMGMVFWAGLFGGCGQTEVKQDNAITNSSEEGKEEGTAEELLRQDGIYAQMVHLQTQSQGWTIV